MPQGSLVRTVVLAARPGLYQSSITILHNTRMQRRNFRSIQSNHSHRCQRINSQRQLHNRTPNSKARVTNRFTQKRLPSTSHRRAPQMTTYSYNMYNQVLLPIITSRGRLRVKGVNRRLFNMFGLILRTQQGRNFQPQIGITRRRQAFQGAIIHGRVTSQTFRVP